jgi:Prealbumin-like fold domain
LDTVDEDGDPGLAKDWANVPQGSSANGSEVRVSDPINGNNDNSFGQGTKEDSSDPVVVSDGIPPNKSDLLNFGVTLEQTAAGGRFLHVFWHRVQDPSGTTNMDFEFNANVCNQQTGAGCSDNGVTPERSAGDVLIQYDLTNGGTRPELFVSKWVATGNKSLCEAANSTPCWGDRINLSAAGDATGSINNVAITDDAAAGDPTDGLATGGSISPRTFGEASINFNAIAGNDPCTGFGSAYLKSRSSDSFTAAMKDFVAPTPLNISNCGAIKVVKTAKHKDTSGETGPNLAATFTAAPTTGNPVTITTNATTGIGCVANVPTGTYNVTEGTPPTGYAKDTSTKSVTVTAGQTCSNVGAGATASFENTPLTDLTVSLNSQVNGGTASTINCKDSAATPNTIIDKAVDAGPPPANGDGSGTATGLKPGTYTCTVVIDP